MNHLNINIRFAQSGGTIRGADDSNHLSNPGETLRETEGLRGSAAGRMPDGWLRGLSRLNHQETSRGASHPVGDRRAPLPSFQSRSDRSSHSAGVELHSPTVPTVELASRGLNELPRDIGPLNRIADLDLSGNELKTFPVDQVLGMASLQNLKLSMESTTGKPMRKSHAALADQGCRMMFVHQGNASAKVVDIKRASNTVLYTTDLDPCLALSIIHGDKALLMHVDSFRGQGAGRLSVRDVLIRHINPNAQDTRVMLVGANAQGSAANVRGVLSVLRELGLERCITMASLGNNYTSAMLHVGYGEGYVGFG
ncbi:MULTISPECIES: hypothetical protein [Ralstonia solanacearum species complex]|uniref:hypothetical protein n=1 Tax=Ralstonia solanacearum species complex TaxID=3116862 RepID=UPI0011405A86|nr:hypothetical protein [Ralstonia solanacearum]